MIIITQMGSTRQRMRNSSSISSRSIHLNDTQKALGSRVDRHARIATGTIGLAEFKLLMHDTRFADVPKILETPYETLADHKEEIQLLQSI